MKIIALYLPQFHSIPENDVWWGNGFTEWVNMKKAKPLFENHHQPRIPLNNKYYDLSDVEVMRWQAKLAKENGVYGFCFYHYWFNGKLLLEKPVENFLKDKSIDFNYCISWANEHWTDQWVSEKWTVLIEQKYGDRPEWKQHFEYLLPYFKDDRYIKYNGKPLFVIYKPELIDKRKEMFEYWNELAMEEGIPGICFIFQRAEMILNNNKIDLSMFDFCAEYQPGLAVARLQLNNQKFIRLRKMKRKFFVFLGKHFKIDHRSVVLTPQGKGPRKDDYDLIWNRILEEDDIFPRIIPSAFVDWDNTPRRGEKGSVMLGANPTKFKEYFIKLIIKAKDKYMTDMMFVFAWNEWAEGGYLEPDTLNDYGYLEAIKNALIETNEFPYDVD